MTVGEPPAGSRAARCSHVSPYPPRVFAPTPIRPPRCHSRCCSRWHPVEVMRIGPPRGPARQPATTASAPPICACSWNSRPMSCRSAATASPARAWLRRLLLADRAAGGHVVGRRPGWREIHRGHRHQRAAAGRPDSGGRFPVAGGRRADQPAELLAGHHHQRPVPQSSRLVKAEPAQGLWQTLPGSMREPTNRRPAVADQRLLRPDTDPEVKDRVGLHRRRQLRPQPTGGAVSRRARKFGDRSRWQGWAAGPDGGWNKPPNPL